MQNLSKSPCIGICSTTFGDLVCRGCKRYSHEITEWNQYQNQEKSLVWQRLAHCRVKVVRNHLTITSYTLLQQALQQNSLINPLNDSPYWSVYDLIKILTKTPNQERPLNEILDGYGLSLMPTCSSSTLPELFAELDQKLYELAEAHYQHQHRQHQQQLPHTVPHTIQK